MRCTGSAAGETCGGDEAWAKGNAYYSGERVVFSGHDGEERAGLLGLAWFGILPVLAIKR